MVNENNTVVPFMSAPKPTNDNAHTMAAANFPTVFRLEGYRQSKPRMRKGVKRLPKLIREPVMYTFDAQDPCDYLRPKWTPVTHLDPKLDYGWIIVRHHIDESHLLGYIHDQVDWFFTEQDAYEMSLITETEHGYFTLLHRPPPKGAIEPLLIQVWRPISEKPMDIEEKLYQDDSYRIYLPDGSVSTDNEMLYPFIRKLRKR